MLAVDIREDDLTRRFRFSGLKIILPTPVERHGEALCCRASGL
jgi:hypothetical protein